MKEAYVSFEVAKLLKEKGFDEPCYMSYWLRTIDSIELVRLEQSGNNYSDCLYAPTHQMAMAWLREEYDIFIDVGYDDLDFYWLIESIANDIPVQDRPKLLKNGTACHRTYEEAVEAALKYSLENLI